MQSIDTIRFARKIGLSLLLTGFVGLLFDGSGLKADPMDEISTSPACISSVTKIAILTTGAKPTRIAPLNYPSYDLTLPDGTLFIMLFRCDEHPVSLASVHILQYYRKASAKHMAVLMPGQAIRTISIVWTSDHSIVKIRDAKGRSLVVTPPFGVWGVQLVHGEKSGVYAGLVPTRQTDLGYMWDIDESSHGPVVVKHPVP